MIRFTVEENRMKKGFVAICIAVLLLTIIFSGCLNEQDTNSSTIPYTIHDARFYGTWIDKSANKTIECSLAWYTFYSNGTVLTPKGTFNWFIKTYHYDNDSNWTLHLENSSTSYEIHSFSFSNDNTTLNLIRHKSCLVPNSIYNKLNETLSVEEVVHLVTFSIDESEWFGMNLTVVGYYNFTSKLVSSMVEPSYSLNIHMDHISILGYGKKYYCKGFLRDYYETPLIGDFVLDVEETTEV